MRANKLLGGLILLAVVVLLNLPLPAALRLRATVRDNTVQGNTLLHYLVAEGRMAFEAVLRARSAIGDRESLLDEIANLRQENRRLELFEQENQDLRRQLEFKQACDHRLLLGAVISRGGMGGWWHSLRINRGYEDGVREDQAVIGIEGLVGRTRDVTRHTADVLLVTDPQCRVACRLPRTGALGIANGRGVSVSGQERLTVAPMAQPFEVEYVDKNAVIRQGDGVVTSGLGGVFPEGLLIGHVTDHAMDASGLFQRLQLQPSADLGALRYVWVVVE